MKGVALANGAALAATLAAALAGGFAGAPRDHGLLRTNEISIATVKRVKLPDGREGIADAGGHVTPIGRYERIISASLLTDRLLSELAEPDRVVAYSVSGARNSPWNWRLTGKAHVDGLGPIEPLIQLKPDLVLLNSFGADARSDKLRAAGLNVFDLGELRGVQTLLSIAEVVGELLGAPERGRRYAHGFRQRIERVALPLGDRPRRRGLYLMVIAGNIYGGTRGTSYNDVLVHAGLVDVAAERYTGWPQYSAEQVSALAPELIVTKDSMAEAVCAHPVLQALQPCLTKNGVYTLPAGLLDEPGPAMLDAAEALFEMVYPGLAPGAAR